MSLKINSIMYIFEQIVKSRFSGSIIIFVLMITFILNVLLFPPLSLVDQLLNIGYKHTGPNNGVIRASDDPQITVLLTGIKRSLWIKLDVVPGTKLTADNDLFTAVENIPPNLVMRGPIYYLQHRGDSLTAVVLTIPIPDGAEPHHTLDLYTWNGEMWAWLPNHKIQAKNVIETELDFLPETVAVMQTESSDPGVSTYYDPTIIKLNGFKDMGLELNPQGLLVNSDGSITGNPMELSPEIQKITVTIIPTIRNWSDDRSNPVNNFLSDSEIRQRHIKAIVDLVQRNTYRGINLDYRGIDPSLRYENTVFLEQLRQALPDNKYLSVRVDLPRQLSSGSWDTGAYDWQAIGRLADLVKIPTSPDPKAYAPGGDIEAMLDWATGQVNRSKLQLLFRAHGTEQIDDVTHDISYQQALEHIGEVMLVDALGGINPGQKIEFTLSGLPTSTGIQVDDTTGTYWFAYLDANNRHHTVYLENTAGIAHTLQLVTKYNLRGVAIQNLPGNAEDSQAWEVVNHLLDGTTPPVESQYTLVWLVQRQDGRVMAERTVDLSSPNYEWTAPEAGGAYEVAASIFSSQKAGVAVARGSVRVLVATPTPSPTSMP